MVTIHEGPVPAPERWVIEGAGALICFEGVVRPTEAEIPIMGLEYQTYDPMAENELRRLAGECMSRFCVLAVLVQHSRGFVPHGACSFRLRLASAHRKEGLAAMDWFIDQMKKVVPIWKKAVPQDSSMQSTS